MFHDAVGFVTGHCDIRTLGALESLSQNFRACATGNALWCDLLKDRSPFLGKQPGIFARQVLKQMVQFVPMHMRPFPTSVEQISSAELREYYWCVDVQYLREPLFSGLVSFQSSGQLLNEVCAQKMQLRIFWPKVYEAKKSMICNAISGCLSQGRGILFHHSSPLDFNGVCFSSIRCTEVCVMKGWTLL